MKALALSIAARVARRGAELLLRAAVVAFISFGLVVGLVVSFHADSANAQGAGYTRGCGPCNPWVVPGGTWSLTGDITTSGRVYAGGAALIGASSGPRMIQAASNGNVGMTYTGSAGTGAVSITAAAANLSMELSESAGYSADVKSGSAYIWNVAGTEAARLNATALTLPSTTLASLGGGLDLPETTSVIDFPSLEANSCSSSIVAVTGAAFGDACTLGFSSATEVLVDFDCRVNSAGNVMVVACNESAGGAQDPASRTYTIRLNR